MSRTTKLVALINIVRVRGARKACNQHRYMSRSAALEAIEYDEPERAPFTTTHEHLEEASDINDDRSCYLKMKNWIPHPRSGIYYPEGHDWVMNDVSEDAASLGQSHAYWLRNDHGVEKHDPDLHSADDYFLAPTLDHA